MRYFSAIFQGPLVFVPYTVHGFKLLKEFCGFYLQAEFTLTSVHPNKEGPTLKKKKVKMLLNCYDRSILRHHKQQIIMITKFSQIDKYQHAGLHHKGDVQSMNAGSLLCDSLVDVQVGLVMQAPKIKGQCHKIMFAYCLRFGLPGTAWLMYGKPL